MNTTHNTLTSMSRPYNHHVRLRVENNEVSPNNIHSNSHIECSRATRLLGEWSAHYLGLPLLNPLVTAGLPLNSNCGAPSSCHLYLVIPNPRRKPDVLASKREPGRLDHPPHTTAVPRIPTRVDGCLDRPPPPCPPPSYANVSGDPIPP